MKNILIIEDDKSLCFLLGKILGKSYEVHSASNGIDALCWLTEGNFPDLIISDIMMPSMDGFELVENLRISGLFKDIPVIILSGFDDPSAKTRCAELGIDAYLSKPFNPEWLLEVIENVIESKKIKLYV